MSDPHFSSLKPVTSSLKTMPRRDWFHTAEPITEIPTKSQLARQRAAEAACPDPRGALADAPTDAAPGTAPKIAVLAARRKAGVELHHPADVTLETIDDEAERACDLLGAIRESHRPGLARCRRCRGREWSVEHVIRCRTKPTIAAVVLRCAGCGATKRTNSAAAKALVEATEADHGGSDRR